MPLKALTYRPGISRESTNYANEGAWYGGDKVRFRSGFPENIGGWSTFSVNSYTDVCRTLHNWNSIIGNNYTGVGTNLRYFVEFNGELYNITPYKETIALSANPLTTVLDEAKIYVTSPSAHGIFTDGYVNIAGATTTNGIPDTEINGTHTVVVTSTTTFYFTTTTTATSSGTGGGASITLSVEAAAGLPFATIGLGWGVGTWGRGTWGSAATSGGAVETLGYWTHDNYGQDLVICPTEGEIYYWAINTSTGAAGAPTALAVKLSSLTGAADCPTVAIGIVVTDENHLVALGCNAIGSTTKTPLLVRWADQDNPALWTPGITTSAGSQQLTFGDTIVTAIKTRQETLIFTDSAVYGMQYLGPPFYFGFQPRSTNITIASSFAAISVNNITYWMGYGKFFTYNGVVETLPCSLRQYIFNDFNYQQISQVFVGSDSEYNELWWFYCSSSSLYPDRYVSYNYLERVWAYGTMDRTAWVDCPARNYPIAAHGGNLIYQEYGLDDNETGTPVPISSYIQSADFDIDDGDHFAFVKRLIPDVTFSGSTATAPQVTFTLYARDFPGGPYNEETSEPITRSQAVPVEEYTQQTWLRLRGRQVSIRVASNALGVKWALGIPRIDTQPDGRR